MLAAIEIYNKPQFRYRSECFIILMINSWELAFKAILSKNRIRIYEEKKRKKECVTIGLSSCIEKVKPLLPPSIEFKPISENIKQLLKYRNKCVHFYNVEGFDALIYALSQTSIINYRDIIKESFNRDIASEVNLNLLPLSFGTVPDPIKFLSSSEKKNQQPVINEFRRDIFKITNDLEKNSYDTGKFLTTFEVKMQSTKKIQSADIVAGVSGDSKNGVLMVSKPIDPNISHPLNRKKVLEKIPKKHRGTKFNSWTFDALLWYFKLKEKEHICWKNQSNKTFQYSHELVSLLKKYTKDDILKAREFYPRKQRKMSKQSINVSSK